MRRRRETRPGSWCVLVTMLVIATTVRGGPDASSNLATDKGLGRAGWGLETVGDLDGYLEDLAEQARLRISQAFTEDARRFRREAELPSVVVTGSRLTELQVDGVGGDWSRYVTGLHFLTHHHHHHHHTTYWILGTQRSGQQQVIAWSAESQSMTLLATFQLTDVSIGEVNRIAAQVYSGYLFLALGSTRSRLVSVVCIELSSKRVMMPHTIPSRGMVGALHLFQSRGELYLLVGETYYATPGDGRAESALYVLVGEYFDRREGLTLGASGVQDVASFTFSGNTYLVLGMKNPSGSQVHEVSGVEERVNLVQQLVDKDVVRVHHYHDLHDHRHYLLLLDLATSPKIYWWSNNQLHLWQVLEHSEPVVPAASVSVLPLHTLENLIMISTKSSITLYTEDSNGHYGASFIVGTSCPSVKDVWSGRLGGNYLLFYLCGARVEARVLVLENLMLGEIGDGDGGDPLLRCLADVRKVLEGRRLGMEYLREVMAGQTLMTVDRDQTWSGDVSFEELVVRGKTNLGQTVVIPPPAGGEAGTSSSSHIQQTLATLQSEIEEVTSLLPGVVSYTRTQTLTPPPSISLSSLNTQTATFNSLTLHKVNGVALRDLTRNLLLDGVEQEVTGVWQVDHLTTDVLFTRPLHHHTGTLAGVPTPDYMRTNVARQVVSGRHTYTLLSAGLITTTGRRSSHIEINGVATSEMVTRGSDLVLHGNLTLASLRVAGQVTAGRVNHVDLREVAKNAVYTDTPAITLAGRYVLDRLTVLGNLATTTINGLNLAQLDASVVKKYGDYTMRGGLVYKVDVLVTGSVVSESVNEVLLSEVLDATSATPIPATYTFGQVTVTSDFSAGTVNGLDLGNEVALVDGEWRLEGRVRFLSSVSVTGAAGVTLGERVRVNGVDPSHLESQLPLGGTLVLEQQHNLTSPLRVAGDVTAVSINGLQLSALESRYWRKSVLQHITVYPHFNSAVFNGGVVGETLNGRLLTDFLSRTEAQQVTGRYSFQGVVEVKGQMVSGLVDSVDVVRLSGRVVTLNTQQTITVPMSFLGRVNVLGDLDLKGHLNGLDLTTDLMRLDQTNPHTEHLSFLGPTVIHDLEIVNSNLKVSLLNDLDINAVTEDLVMRHQEATITGHGGLHFAGDLRVKELIVPGLVDGVDLVRLVSRAMGRDTLGNGNKPPRLTVSGDVHFALPPTLAIVNGRDWTSHLGNVVTVNSTGKVSGQKVFAGPLHIQGDLAAPLIDGVDVVRLASRLLQRSAHQVITAHYTFTGDITADEVYAPKLDGVDIASLLLVDAPGGVTVGEVVWAGQLSLIAGLTADTSVLDGCDLSTVRRSPFHSSGDGGVVVVEGEVEVDTLVVRGKATTSPSSTLLGPNIFLLHFLRRLVLKSSDQDITAPVVVVVGNVNVGRLDADVINNITIEDLLTQTLTSPAQNTVLSCDLHLTRGVRVGELVVERDVRGKAGGVVVNGVAVADVASRAVLRHSRTRVVVAGRKVFTAGLATNHLVAERVGGIGVGQLLVVGETGALAPSHLAFKAPITVLGNLKVGGTVDGVNLTKLFSTRVRLDTSQTLTAEYHFHSLRVTGDLTTEVINQVTLTDLVLRSGVELQVISGTKVIRGEVRVEGSIEAGQINGQDLRQLSAAVVRLDQNITVQADVTFAETVTCLGGVAVARTVNDMDLSQLSLDVATIQQQMALERARVEGLLAQARAINHENYKLASDLYARLSYLELQEEVVVVADGEVVRRLWGGPVPGSGGEGEEQDCLKVTSCPDPSCVCQVQSRYFKVEEEGNLSAITHLGYRMDILAHPHHPDRYVVLSSTCEGGVGEARVEIKYYFGSSSEVAMSVNGWVMGAGLMFGPGDVTHLVLFLRVLPGGGSRVSVVRLSGAGEALTEVGRRESARQGATLDLTQVEGLWMVVVTYSGGASQDEGDLVTSELMTWNSATSQLEVRGQYAGGEGSSGMFLLSLAPLPIHFLSLARPRSSCSPHYREGECEDSVLILRYNATSRSFDAWQSLEAAGVTDQAWLRVDRSFYLLLVSPVQDALFVYEYWHPEGFLLHSKLHIGSPHSVAVVRGPQGEHHIFVATPLAVVRFSVYTKGVDPDWLQRVDHRFGKV